MAAIICASGQRRFAELFLLKLIKWTEFLFLNEFYRCRGNTLTMREFHEYTCNGFGDIWWTDNPIYFTSIDMIAPSMYLHFNEDICFLPIFIMSVYHHKFHDYTSINDSLCTYKMPITIKIIGYISHNFKTLSPLESGKSTVAAYMCFTSYSGTWGKLTNGAS